MLSSAYPAKSVFAVILKNVSQIYILNKSGPKIDPCGTPENNISHDLKAESALVPCLHLLR